MSDWASAERKRELRAQLVARDGDGCQHCGRDVGLTIDHKLAMEAGGTHELENLQLLCRRCNSTKGKREDKTVRFASTVTQAGFTVVPNVVLLDETLLALAVRLYALLAYYARLNEEAWPGQELLVRQANASERSVRGALRQLEKAGLLRTRQRGRGRTNAYILLDPKAAAGNPDVTGKYCRSSGSRPANDAGPDRQILPVHRVDAEAVEERLESADADSSLHEERASAPEPDPGSSLDQARTLWRSLGDEREQQTLRALVELAERRGLTDGWSPTAAVELVRGEFRNRDIAGEAGRFRDFYSPGGLGENRQISNLVARWREWLKRAPSLDTLVSRDRPLPGRRRRGRLSAPSLQRATAPPCPINDQALVAEFKAVWAPIAAKAKSGVSDATWDLYLTHLHPHAVDGGRLVLGATQSSWIAERFSTLLVSAAGQPVEIVACAGRPDLTEDAA